MGFRMTLEWVFTYAVMSSQKSESAYMELLSNNDQVCWLHIFKVKTSAKTSLHAATTSMSFQRTNNPILFLFSSGNCLVLNITLPVVGSVATNSAFWNPLWFFYFLLGPIIMLLLYTTSCKLPLPKHYRNGRFVNLSVTMEHHVLCTREMSPSTHFYFLRFNL